jgi:hypothetical protein
MDSNVPSNSKWKLEFKLPKGPFFHVMCVCVFLDLLLFFLFFYVGQNIPIFSVKTK